MAEGYTCHGLTWSFSILNRELDIRVDIDLDISGARQADARTKCTKKCQNELLPGPSGLSEKLQHPLSHTNFGLLKPFSL